MQFRRDKIFDILSILDVLKKLSTNFLNIKELRIQAVNEVAKAESLKTRYKDFRSAYERLMDACRNRLKPDVDGIHVFDKLVDKWLHRNSNTLREILLKHSKDKSQKDAVINLFMKNQ